MELIEEEIEIYNARMRLLSWLFEELQMQPVAFKEELNEKGKELPLNH